MDELSHAQTIGYEDAWLLGGPRTPFADYKGTLRDVSAVERELGLDRARVNVNGGAIGIGHPLGATGVRCTLTLAREPIRSKSRWGVATACAGGGQGVATLIENPSVRAS